MSVSIADFVKNCPAGRVPMRHPDGRRYYANPNNGEVTNYASFGFLVVEAPAPAPKEVRDAEEVTEQPAPKAPTRRGRKKKATTDE